MIKYNDNDREKLIEDIKNRDYYFEYKEGREQMYCFRYLSLLDMACDSLKNDREIVELAISYNSGEFLSVGEELKKDVQFMKDMYKVWRISLENTFVLERVETDNKSPKSEIEKWLKSQQEKEEIAAKEMMDIIRGYKKVDNE